MPDCAQLQKLYEPYALGALDPAERADLEQHLARYCPECTRGVERARGRTVSPPIAPPQREPPAAPHRSWIPAWAWIAAAVLAAVAVYTTVQTSKFQSESAELAQRSRAMGDRRKRYFEALNIIAASETRQIQLHPAQVAGPLMSAYWNPQAGLVVLGDKLPELASGRTLQLWIVPRQGMSISAGLFRPDATGEVLVVLPLAIEAMAAAKALQISEEPVGGSSQPTSTPGWAGPVG